MSIIGKVTDQLIDIMEQGIIPWHKGWLAGSFSHVTKKEYTGINRLLLPEGEYATFGRIRTEGGIVTKGSKSYTAIYYGPINPDEDDVKFCCKVYKIFDIKTQVTGINPTSFSNSKIERADLIVSNYKGMPELKQGSIAAFYPETFHIEMPSLDMFENERIYYSTLFHEMVHSTGTTLRKDEIRDISTKAKSREELVAEMGSALLCAKCNISNDDLIKNSAAYIQEWLKPIKEDPRSILYAAKQAERAVNLILGRDIDEDES